MTLENADTICNYLIANRVHMLNPSQSKRQLFIKVIVQKNRVDRYRPARTAQAHFYPQVQEKSDGTLYHEILQSGGKIIDMHIALGT